MRWSRLRKNIAINSAFKDDPNIPHLYGGPKKPTKRKFDNAGGGSSTKKGKGFKDEDEVMEIGEEEMWVKREAKVDGGSFGFIAGAGGYGGYGPGEFAGTGFCAAPTVAYGMQMGTGPGISGAVAGVDMTGRTDAMDPQLFMSSPYSAPDVMAISQYSPEFLPSPSPPAQPSAANIIPIITLTAPPPTPLQWSPAPADLHVQHVTAAARIEPAKVESEASTLIITNKSAVQAVSTIAVGDTTTTTSSKKGPATSATSGSDVVPASKISGNEAAILAPAPPVIATALPGPPVDGNESKDTSDCLVHHSSTLPKDGKQGLCCDNVNLHFNIENETCRMDKGCNNRTNTITNTSNKTIIRKSGTTESMPNETSTDDPTSSIDGGPVISPQLPAGNAQVKSEKPICGADAASSRAQPKPPTVTYDDNSDLSELSDLESDLGLSTIVAKPYCATGAAAAAPGDAAEGDHAQESDKDINGAYANDDDCFSRTGRLLGSTSAASSKTQVKIEKKEEELIVIGQDRIGYRDKGEIEIEEEDKESYEDEDSDGEWVE